MEAQDLEWRMYGLVPYNISPIQQGIQYGHAVQEFNNEMNNFLHNGEEYSSHWHDTYYAFQKWSEEDKTFIILNGGTTNDSFVDANAPKEELRYKGTLNNHLVTLHQNDVFTAKFFEPDLGDQLTAVVFLVDERVFNRDKYPDFVPTNGLIRRIENQQGYSDWVERMGGEKNVFLRNFLRQFKLA